MLFLLVLLMPAGAADSYGGWSFYYGDPHVHTGASDGLSTDIGDPCGECGSIWNAREEAQERGLDFISFTDHGNGDKTQDAEGFAEVLAATFAASDPATGFVAIPGVELWYDDDETGAPLGHKNVNFFADDETLAALTLADVQLPSGTSAIASCDEMWNHAAGLAERWGPTLVLAHHSAMPDGMGTDWSCHDTRSTTWSPAVEVYSRHGNNMHPDTTFDPVWQGFAVGRSVEEVMDRGLRLGFLGGTDAHDTMSGATCETEIAPFPHPYGGGLTVVVLEAGEPFDRMAIHDAIVARRTYATSGPQVPVLVEYTSGGVRIGGMGEDVVRFNAQDLEIQVRFPAQWEGAVDQVAVRIPGASRQLDRVEDGLYALRIPADVMPPWLYPVVALDGEAIYGDDDHDDHDDDDHDDDDHDDHDDECRDGGSDHEERIWLSPTWISEAPPDLDQDGFKVEDGDCHDGDPSVFPGAVEEPYDGIDQDCDGLDHPPVADDDTGSAPTRPGSDGDGVRDSSGCATPGPGGTHRGLLALSAVLLMGYGNRVRSRRR